MGSEHLNIFLKPMSRPRADFGSQGETGGDDKSAANRLRHRRRTIAEVTTVLSLHTLRELADRIEQAYARRRPGRRLAFADPRVWTAAAATLLQAHCDDPERVPLDPELYVAAQSRLTSFDDPWMELASDASARRYHRRVRRIVRGLREELRAEVQWAERRIRRGESIRTVLTSRGRRLSPLGRFIVASRAGRPELADRFEASARAQHYSCPLYRHASLGLLPAAVAYPFDSDSPPSIKADSSPTDHKVPDFSLN